PNVSVCASTARRRNSLIEAPCRCSLHFSRKSQTHLFGDSLLAARVTRYAFVAMQRRNPNAISRSTGSDFVRVGRVADTSLRASWGSPSPISVFWRLSTSLLLLVKHLARELKCRLGGYKTSRRRQSIRCLRIN